MALDQQRNWDVSMANNLDQITRNNHHHHHPHHHPHHTPRPSRGVKEASTKHYGGVDEPKRHQKQKRSDEGAAWTTPPVHLPDEIIIEILDHVARSSESQHTLASCCLLSHQWYSAAVPFLYARPFISGHNYDPFARTIITSLNLKVRDSPLAKLIRGLNMASLVHQGSKSSTARLLSRTKDNLQDFIAPVATFGSNCLAPLAKCSHLQTLDLSLVSECPPLPDLFRAVSRLDNLHTFRLPRSSGFGGVSHHPDSFTWPPNLADLTLSGGIDAHFIHGVVAFPQTLRSLTIEHCPLAKAFAVTHLLKTAIRPLRNLHTLKIRHMPRLSAHALDDVLFLLPQIRRLSISVDYITPALFDETHFHDPKGPLSDLDESPAPAEPLKHNLHTLELTNSGNPGVEDKITPIDIMIAIDEGSVPHLRVVRVAQSLHWHSHATLGDTEALADVLQEASRRDWVGAGRGSLVGGGEVSRPWESAAGVWRFDDAMIR
ncbi:F-box domain-containing protein [Teratosphaeria destructans]|uniref:F-box domain-containing protein n=1 Tax=Teratosphaeria destructans TaxID=418781 RepID=A0A6C0T954_9PEZI|nr:F-box domain-containing protein [Teratosphaeria destructans]QIA97819.1 F-box domain-containing protein [Teratosphaeria destructans]